MVEKIDTSISQDNISLEDLDAIVKKYASYLGLESASGVQFMELLADNNFNDAGFNKYNLTESDIRQLQEAVDSKKDADYIDLLMKNLLNKNQPGIDTSSISQDEFTGLLQQFANGVPLADILAQAGYDNLDRDYESNAGRMVPVYENGQPVMENGTPKMKPFKSHFSTDFHFIINSLSEYEEILDFQKYLIENRVVSPDTFIGSEGEYSAALEGAIVTVMSYLDQEHYIAEGTDQFNQIMGMDPVFFTQQQYGDYTLDANGIPVPSPEGLKRSQDLKLFNWAVQEISKDYEKFASYNEAMADEQLINQLKSQYQVLTPLQREDEVESWFELKLGRKGSKKEIEDWANNIALNYSSVFKKLVKDMQNLQADVGLRDWETNYLASFGDKDADVKRKSFNELTDLSAQLAQEDPLLQAESQFEQQYAEQMESYEIGKKSIQEDMDILRMIYG
jgi:hypothetical protein